MSTVALKRSRGKGSPAIPAHCQLDLFCQPLKPSENLVAVFMLSITNRERELFLDAVRELAAFFTPVQYDIILYRLGRLLNQDELNWMRSQLG
jgi:hypothetical protein